MKLLLCLECADIFNLTMENKVCTCGNTSGMYIDNLNVEIKGNCKAFGIDNSKIRKAYMAQKIADNDNAEAGLVVDYYKGAPFDAFFIPDTSTSIKRIDK